MSKSVLCENSGQFMNNLLTKLEDLKGTSKTKLDSTIDKVFTQTFNFGSKELILYALGSKEMCSKQYLNL